MFLILLGEVFLLLVMLMFAEDVLLMKDFDSVTGAETVRTLDSENFLGPKILALSLTLTLSSVGVGVILLSRGEAEDLPVIISLVLPKLCVLFPSDLLMEEIVNSSGLDIGGGTDGFCTEAMTWVL